MNYTRREFLKAAGVGSVSFMLQGHLAHGEKIKQKPNILVIMSDEHNAGILGCYGNDIVKTVNLDGLAASGVTFENCYCNSPLCVPSRLSFTSGKYVSRVGAWNNSCWLPSADYPSLPKIMNDAGYESILCGKMHYDRTRRYGFKEIPTGRNKGTKSGKGNRREADDLKAMAGISSRFKKFHPGEKSGILANDQKVTELVVDFLKKRSVRDKPFFMLAGYIAPHFPLIVPQMYWDQYKDKVPMPVIPKGHLDSLALNYKHLRIAFNVEDAPDDVVKKGRELYYGLTHWLDEQIGRVLGAIGKSEFAENTIIIYTTDHGENMGEHGMWWKNCVYDHSAKVPLIVNFPARWKGGQRRTEACSLVDVVQTIAELGSADVPTDWDGDSMVQWLDDPETKWKDLAVSEYYAHNIASGYAMIRMGRFKYVYHTAPDENHPAERELYDMQADPGEFNNLAKDPKYISRIEIMHAALIKQIGEDPDKTEMRCRADYSRGYERKLQQNKTKSS
jgi:choline-sulfatase